MYNKGYQSYLGYIFNIYKIVIDLNYRNMRIFLYDNRIEKFSDYIFSVIKNKKDTS